MRIQKFLIALFSFFLLFYWQAFSQEYVITSQNLRKHILVLSSDSLQGRETGTIGGEKACFYMEKQLQNCHFFQISKSCFQLGDERRIISPESFVVLQNRQYFQYQNFQILLSSAASKNRAVDTNLLVFAGNGISYGKKYDSYKNLDVAGKWVLVLSSKPKGIPEKYMTKEAKIKEAKRRKASGIIFVAEKEILESDNNLEMNVFYDMHKKHEQESIFIANAGSAFADSVLKNHQSNYKKEYEKTLKTVSSTHLSENFAYCINDTTIKTEACNILAFREGQDSIFKKEIIVLSAHFDHLGIDVFSKDIYHGADDNASGSSTLLEIAKKLSSENPFLKRSILLIAFDAEEKGLLGSYYFLDNLPEGIQLSSIKSMLNLDMLGRMKNNEIYAVCGNSQSSKLREVELLAKKYEINILPLKGYLVKSSDQWPFMKKKIPSYFFFTGLHSEYHQPNDSEEKVNYKGIEKIAKLSYDLLLKLANEGI